MNIDKRDEIESAALPSYEEFASNCNSQFSVMLNAEEKTELILTEVTEKKTSKYQEQFSLFFKGKSEVFLPQSIYSLKHTALGMFDLFIVPVGKDKNGYLYEAVFNLILENK